MPRPTLAHAKAKYNWKDQHPIVDAIRSVMEGDSRTYSKLAQDAGISPTTLLNWEKGNVMRPSWPAVHAVLEACGGSIRIQFRERYIMVRHLKSRGTPSFKIVRRVT